MSTPARCQNNINVGDWNSIARHQCEREYGHVAKCKRVYVTCVNGGQTVYATVEWEHPEND